MTQYDRKMLPDTHKWTYKIFLEIDAHYLIEINTQKHYKNRYTHYQKNQ